MPALAVQEPSSPWSSTGAHHFPMLDEGTKRRSATQIANEVAQLGASLGTYATWDASAVSLSTMADQLERALPVWADVLQNPAFDEAELGRVTQNLVSAIAQRKDHPPVVASQVFSRALWGDDHPFGWPDSGTEASLKRIGRADVKRFYDGYYTPNNAVLVV